MEPAPSRRPVVRLLFAALVATASCVSVFGLEEENYGPLEEELCNFAAEICTPEEFERTGCADGGTFDLGDNKMNEVEACFEQTECQAFLACIPSNNPVTNCNESCAWAHDPCTIAPNCPPPCCDGECVYGFCCLHDGIGCDAPQDCCSGVCDDSNTCVSGSG